MIIPELRSIKKQLDNKLAQEEQFILDQHRDMASGRRYGELVIKYEAGRLVMVGRNEKLRPREPR